MQDKEKSGISTYFELGALFDSSDSILMITIGGSAIIVVVIFCVMSVFGMLTGNWDIVHLDPFCGMPLVLMTICFILTGASAVLVARSRGVVNEKGITACTAGFWFEIPWNVLQTVPILEVGKLPDGFLENDLEHQKKFVIQMRGLPLPNILAGICYGLYYRPLRLIPTFIVTPDFRGYELFLERLTDIDCEDDVQ